MYGTTVSPANLPLAAPTHDTTTATKNSAETQQQQAATLQNSAQNARELYTEARNLDPCRAGQRRRSADP